MTNWLKKLDKHHVKLSDLTLSQQEELCVEIREKLLEVVSANGGHLASNLGTVELTVALNEVFDFPKDTLIFDVGHQCYTHKLLTGRLDRFDTLRRENGISGFPRPSESIYDSFVEGHASTSISQAVGLSYSKIISGEDSMTVAVIGDGALTGGLAYEAMNNISNVHKNLIVVLNDNSMSISKSVGSVSRYLLKVRNSSFYLSLKNGVLSVLRYLPVIGPAITRWIVRYKTDLRRRVYGGTLFEELGFNYVGPLDGHDLQEMEEIFSQLKKIKRGPYLVHVITQKGKGYPLAEENPGAYHGVSGFEIEKDNPDISSADSFSNTFGRKLSDMAGNDSSICAITAAMKYGTGLQYFSHRFPERFFDVGIAEQHAVTMASGLAAGGMHPFFCVYSTFLQRSFDMLIHDISLGNMDFVLCIDRAGFVGDDGETHQGLYDVAMLSSIGTYKIISPSNYADLLGWMDKLPSFKGPVAIRYPRGREDERIRSYRFTGNDYDLIRNSESSDILIITYGREYAEAVNAVKLLSAEGISADILKLNVIYPLNDNALFEAESYSRIYFLEEAVRRGGIGEQFLDRLQGTSFNGNYTITAVENTSVKQAPVERQLEVNCLDAVSVYKSIKEDKK